MDFGYNIAIVGATGCLGRELTLCVHDWVPVKELFVYATKPSQGERLDTASDSVVVKGFGEDGFSEEVLSILHAVIFACPSSVVTSWADRLAEEGIAVIDATGVLGPQIGYTIAGIAEHDDDFSAHRMLSVPSPSTLALAKIWTAIQSLQPVQMSSVISVSASRFGQKGINELAQQVRGLLNIQDSPTNVFPDGLAFDILPSIGNDNGGPSSAEQKVNFELSNVIQIQSDRFRTRLQVTPIFAGVTAHVQVSLSRDVLVEEVVELFEQAEGIDFRQDLPNLRSTIGDSDLFVGRVQINPWNRGIELQFHCDNVAFTIGNTMHCLQRLHQMEML